MYVANHSLPTAARVFWLRGYSGCGDRLLARDIQVEKGQLLELKWIVHPCGK
jgi:hypothetical protein